MKRFITIIIPILAAVVITGCTSSNPYYYAYDKGDCKTTKFDDVDHDLDINDQWRYETLYLTWDQYDGEEFYGYYIVRSEGADNCPYYYVGGDYHEYKSKKSQAYFKDEDIVSGEDYYYRVCVRETDREVMCGSVLKVSVY